MKSSLEVNSALKRERITLIEHWLCLPALLLLWSSVVVAIAIALALADWHSKFRFSSSAFFLSAHSYFILSLSHLLRFDSINWYVHHINSATCSHCYMPSCVLSKRNRIHSHTHTHNRNARCMNDSGSRTIHEFLFHCWNLMPSIVYGYQTHTHKHKKTSWFNGNGQFYTATSDFRLRNTAVQRANRAAFSQKPKPKN